MGMEKRTGKDRRAGSKEQISTLVVTRTETLALYADLAGRRPFSEEHGTARVLQRFCQALIDYTASAHFQLYRHMVEKQEKRTHLLQVAEQIFPRILETTAQILEFNDKYEKPALKGRTDELADDLSHLGEVLADRIQLEDQIIQAVHRDRRNADRPITQ